MRKIAISLLISSWFLPASGLCKARQVNDHHWAGVERIVAIGDLHGDWDQYMAVMRAAGLVDRKGKWSGGNTHLVQTGDIPDRGPDSRRIIDHLQGLKKQAKRKHGYVHTLIGNHDVMNVYGDLRYVHPGEYEAFRDRNSERLRELQWQHQLSAMEARDPEGFAAMDVAAYRGEWQRQFPQGWVEHRQAWQVSGDYGKIVMENPVAVQLNDTIFLHGGLSAKYCSSTLSDLTARVHDALVNFDYQNAGILEDDLGPLWYRGLAQDDEELREAMVTAILDRYDASRIVVGHTPTSGVVWPRFDGRVILNDTGIASYYGGHIAFLEINAKGAIGHHGEAAIPIPPDNAGLEAYLRSVIELDPENPQLRRQLEELLAPPMKVAQQAASADPADPLTEQQAEAALKAAAEQARREAWLSPDNCP